MYDANTTTRCKESWCSSCEVVRYREKFNEWTSVDTGIDAIIRQSQLKPEFPEKILEWIDYQKFSDEKKFLMKVISEKFILQNELGIYNKQMGPKWCNEMALKILKDQINFQSFLNEIFIILHFNDLNDFLKKKKDLKYLERITILGWIASGLLTMHENSQIHCDLHPGPRYLGLIADFGQCRTFNNINSIPIGDLLVGVAPEVIEKHQYTKESDIYSYGKIDKKLFPNNAPFLMKVLKKCCCQNRPSDRPKIKKVVVFHEFGLDTFRDIFRRELNELRSVKHELNRQSDINNMKNRLITSLKNLLLAIPIERVQFSYECRNLNSILENSNMIHVDYIRPMLDAIIEHLSIYFYWFAKIKNYDPELDSDREFRQEPQPIIPSQVDLYISVNNISVM
ncbi:5495_t:CDS:2, partial [Gigaspora margarita]